MVKNFNFLYKLPFQNEGLSLSYYQLLSSLVDLKDTRTKEKRKKEEKKAPSSNHISSLSSLSFLCISLQASEASMFLRPCVNTWSLCSSFFFFFSFSKYSSPQKWIWRKLAFSSYPIVLLRQDLFQMFLFQIFNDRPIHTVICQHHSSVSLAWCRAQKKTVTK